MGTATVSIGAGDADDVGGHSAALISDIESLEEAAHLARLRLTCARDLERARGVFAALGLKITFAAAATSKSGRARHRGTACTFSGVGVSLAWLWVVCWHAF